MSTSAIVFFSTVAVLLIWGVAIYNQLVALTNRYKNGFAQIEVQLKRRYDLIPNLVETAKGYLSHERETLEAVIQARNEAQRRCRPWPKAASIQDQSRPCPMLKAPLGAHWAS